jgi:AcrR family transcriptional regulator
MFVTLDVCMPKPRKATRESRRRPQQQRSQRTVEAVLDAVARVLKREGAAGVTTNRIAQVAGVSIGSVYQYFPDKHAIYRALRQRHVEQMVRLVEVELVERADADLETLLRGLIDAMIAAHAIDPGLYDLLLRQAPHDAELEADTERRIRGAFRLAISAHAEEFERPPELDRLVFILRQSVEALAHAVVLYRPASLSLSAAKEEAARAVFAYLRAHGWKRKRS